MDKLFSERYGYVVEQLQINSLNRATRGFIWEELYYVFIIQIELGLETEYEESELYKRSKRVLLAIDRDIFKNSYLDKPEDLTQIIKSCKNVVLNSAWYATFDLTEYIIQHSINLFKSKKDYKNALKSFAKGLNTVLETEKVMYRLNSSLIVPITDEAELATISTTLDGTESIKTVQGHIIKALKYLSDRTDPDYHNSIKESVSALEALLRLIAKKPDGTLSEAMREIKKKGVLSLDTHLENTIKSLYLWTSNQGAIRHADKGDSSVIDIDDAKFTLITCCSLVNYLTAKSTKAGISLS